MSETKTSIRFFDTTPVRSVWDEETSKWWLCVTDVVAAIVDTTNPRVYWATVKRRNSELFANCKQLKLKASDGKRLTPAGESTAPGPSYQGNLQKTYGHVARIGNWLRFPKVKSAEYPLMWVSCGLFVCLPFNCDASRLTEKIIRR